MGTEEGASVKLIWSCTPGPIVKGSFGGYSDRLKGIVTAYLLAKKLGREFFIHWEGTTRIADYFDSPYYLGPEPLMGDSVFARLVDKLETDKEVTLALAALRSMEAENLYISCNQFGYSHWTVLSDADWMQSAFADSLNAIFKPGPGLLNHAVCQHLWQAMQRKTVTGLAIRVGDQPWDRAGSFAVPPQDEILKRVRGTGADAVLVVSDSPVWKTEIKALLTPMEVIMVDYQTANPDRSPEDQVKVAFPIFLIEHFLLQRCAIIITGDGGGGRTAAWWGRVPLVELIK